MPVPPEGAPAEAKLKAACQEQRLFTKSGKRRKL